MSAAEHPWDDDDDYLNDYDEETDTLRLQCAICSRRVPVTIDEIEVLDSVECPDCGYFIDLRGIGDDEDEEEFDGSDEDESSDF